jgi:hypothetical protein
MISVVHRIVYSMRNLSMFVDLANQCAADPYSVLGAFIFVNEYSQQSAFNYVLFQRQAYALDTDLVFAECTNLGSMNVGWSAQHLSSFANTNSFTLASAASLAGSVQSLLGQSTTTKTTTFASPSVVPAGGYESSLQKASISSGFGAYPLQPGLAIVAGLNGTGLIPGNNTDLVSLNAASRIAQNAEEAFRTSLLLEKQLHNNSPDLPLQHPSDGITCTRCLAWFEAPRPMMSCTPRVKTTIRGFWPPPESTTATIVGALKLFSVNVLSSDCTDPNTFVYHTVTFTFDDSNAPQYTLQETVAQERDDPSGQQLCSLANGKSAKFTIFRPSKAQVEPAGATKNPQRYSVQILAPSFSRTQSTSPGTCNVVTSAEQLVENGDLDAGSFKILFPDKVSATYFQALWNEYKFKKFWGERPNAETPQL